MDIQAVAKLAKVSSATISRVINNSSKVRPETALHVRRIVEQSGYVPNASARSLRVRHSKLFGLIVSDVKNPFFPELIDGFEALATAHDIDVIFTHTSYDPKRLTHCLRRLVERNVDGIAMMTSEFAPDAVASVLRRNIPLILLDQMPNESEFTAIMTDFDSGFAEAIRYLKGLGHENIGFLSGPINLVSVKHRRMAFLSAMKNCGLKAHKEWVISGDLNVDGGREAATALLTLQHRPTAIVTTNDLMAVGVLQAAHQLEIAVPQELSVVGFDDLPVAAMVNPPLTTISVSRHDIAANAFAFLLNATPRATGKVLAGSQVISPRLLVRGSTAPPAADKSQAARRA